MLFSAILITICNAIYSYSFIIQDSYNVLLKDNADYTVDIEFKEDDYEMIDQKQRTNFNLEDENKFNELNKWASKEYNENILTKRDVSYRNSETINGSGKTVEGSADKFDSTTYTRPLTQLARNKREIKIDDEMEYNYVDLVNEYYDDTVTDTYANNTYLVKEADLFKHGIINSLKDIVLIKYENYNCTKSDTKGIGLKAIKCLWNEYNTHGHLAMDVRTRLWRIIKIWSLVYLIIAVPLWCTRGWCCCCLCCKFFKPRKTIDEARKYVLLNPPGVFKTKAGDVHYDATEQEKESYEEFEHFIRTL